MNNILKKYTPKSGLVIVSGLTGSSLPSTIGQIVNQSVFKNGLVVGDLNNSNIQKSISDSQLSQIDYTNFCEQNIEQFIDANRNAMRRKPDAILLGEFRNEETIQAALELALTGHNVFGTVHADCVEGVLPRLCNYVYDEDTFSFLKKLISNTKLIINKKIVMNIKTQENIEVFEYLNIDENLKSELLKSKNTKQIQRKISEIMERSSGDKNASLRFEAQAKTLLDQGLIDNTGYKFLSNLVDDKD